MEWLDVVKVLENSDEFRDYFSTRFPQAYKQYIDLKRDQCKNCLVKWMTGLIMRLETFPIWKDFKENYEKSKKSLSSYDFPDFLK